MSHTYSLEELIKFLINKGFVTKEEFEEFSTNLKSITWMEKSHIIALCGEAQQFVLTGFIPSRQKMIWKIIIFMLSISERCCGLPKEIQAELNKLAIRKDDPTTPVV